MKKDLAATIKAGREIMSRHQRSELDSEDLNEIRKLSQDEMFYLIVNSYYAGVSAGYNANTNERKSRRSKK